MVAYKRLRMVSPYGRQRHVFSFQLSALGFQLREAAMAPRSGMNNRRAEVGRLDLQQSIMSCLLKTISTVADVYEALIV